jgi:sulfur-carrier protein
VAVRVVVMPPFDREFFGGTDRFEVTAKTLFGVVNRLDELGPGFADLADVRAAFAVDGVVQPDWSVPLADAKEVVVVQKIAGG